MAKLEFCRKVQKMIVQSQSTYSFVLILQYEILSRKNAVAILVHHIYISIGIPTFLYLFMMLGFASWASDFTLIYPLRVFSASEIATTGLHFFLYLTIILSGSLFHLNHPNVFDGDRCFISDTDADMKVRDATCSDQYKSICEIKKRHRTAP
mgnify:CR=1 FL=1